MGKETPFKEDLIPTNMGGRKFKFFEFKNNKDVVVRAIPLNKFSNIFGNKKNERDSFLLAKNMFDEVKNKYRIDIPAEYVLGKNDNGNNVVFALTDKIEGNSPRKIEVAEKNKKELFSKFNQLFLSLVKYLRDKYLSEEKMMWDIAGEQQYVLGKKHNETEEKIYMIDTDLNYVENSGDFIYTSLRELTDFVSILEKKLSTKFPEVREQIKELSEEISSEDKRLQDFTIKKIDEFINK